MARTPKAPRGRDEINYEALLADFFHTVTHYGAATKPEAQLMRWMGWDKQTAGFWKDVQTRFQKVLDDDGYGDEGWQLFAITNDGHITLVCMDPPGTTDEDRWCKSVRGLAARPSPGRRKGNTEED